MYKYRVTIEAWPFSTNLGEAVDQKNAGQRRNNFIVTADGMSDAYKQAELITIGMRTNPKVWQTPIISIIQVDYLESEYVSKSNDINKKMEEALSIAHAAMCSLRTALHDEPAVRGREWIPLGTTLNDAIRAVYQALPTKV